MKELLANPQLDLPERDLLTKIDLVSSELGHSLTPSQLYYECSGYLFDPAYMTTRSFERLINKGLYAGLIDWDIPSGDSSSTAVKCQTSDGAGVEIWCRASGMTWWLASQLESSNVTLVCNTGFRFTPHQVYAAINRLESRVEHGIHIGTLFDPSPRFKNPTKTLQRLLTRLLIVRLSRSSCPAFGRNSSKTLGAIHAIANMVNDSLVLKNLSLDDKPVKAYPHFELRKALCDFLKPVIR
jgi:hypothetical protein